MSSLSEAPPAQASRAPTMPRSGAPGGLRQTFHPLTLTFRDEGLEARFRAAERPRNHRLTRLTLILAILVSIPFLFTDQFLMKANQELLLWLRLLLLEGTLLLLLYLSYRPEFRTRWPLLLVALELGYSGFYAVTNVLGQASELIVGGFTLVIMAAYALVPLIFAYGLGAALVSTVLYTSVVIAGGLVSRDAMILLLIQFALANLLGAVILYGREFYRRRDFANMRDIEAERARHRQLLLQVLPESVADRLQRHETVAERHEDVTVLFADVVNFTELSARVAPAEVVDLLNRMFRTFDALVARQGVETIKTVGDAYMAAGGLNGEPEDHTAAMARLALEMADSVAAMAGPRGEAVQVRVGLNCGPVQAGVIGHRRFLYDVWGDTVNLASRMMAMSPPGRVQLTAAVLERLHGRFPLEPRGEIMVKGKGPMPVWLLAGPAPDGPKA